MANIKYIIATLVGSTVLLGFIVLYVGYHTGEVNLLSQSPGSATVNQQVPPGPLTNNQKPTSTSTAATTPTNTQKPMNPETKNPTATFHTSKGDVTLELFKDAMPITVGNFEKLAKEGFYNNTKFHRVIAGFMIQAGDPNSKGDDSSKYGTGGPGYTIQDEFIKDSRLTNVRGTIAMANTGQPNSGGSQFFINLVDNVGLDFDKPPAQSSHPVFGKVVAGMDVVDAIGGTKTGARDLPVDPVIIKSIAIAE